MRPRPDSPTGSRRDKHPSHGGHGGQGGGAPTSRARPRIGRRADQRQDRDGDAGGPTVAASNAKKAGGSGVAPVGRLIGAHARAQALVLLRTPAQVLFLLLAPAAALLAIVTPQQHLAGDPDQSAQAFAQMAVLGGLAVSVFGLGINAAEERASPWSTHLRTLPVSGWVITVSRLLVTAVAVAGSMVPLTVAALTTTALPQALADRPVTTLPAAAAVAIAGCVPFLGLALLLGFSFSPPTTVALTQVVVAPLAFAGGLVVPPRSFPGWLEQVSLLTPTRALREAVLGVLEGRPVAWGSLLVWAIWSLLALAGAARAYARDEGRRFR